MKKIFFLILLVIFAYFASPWSGWLRFFEKRGANVINDYLLFLANILSLSPHFSAIHVIKEQDVTQNLSSFAFNLSFSIYCYNICFRSVLASPPFSSVNNAMNNETSCLSSLQVFISLISSNPLLTWYQTAPYLLIQKN